MKSFQLGCVVAVMVSVVAGRCGESHGADPTRGAISDDKATPQREASNEEPAARPLTVNRTGPEPPPAIAPFDAEQARKHQEAWALHLGLPVEWTNSIGMKCMLIPPGEFLMGSAESPEEQAKVFPGTEPEWFRSEQPQHQVRITRPFYLGVYEVTQGEYEGVMGRNPSFFSQRGGRDQVSGDTRRLPVECVSWEEAKAFCDKLSRLEAEKKAGMTYCLPTEAQWEYACRAGTSTPFHWGAMFNGVEANCDGTGPYGTEDKGPSLRRPTRVGSYAANAFGLYDMHGNVWELCRDWWDAEYYAKSPPEDPPGPATGSVRVLRGSGWNHPASFCRSASRSRFVPDSRLNYLGFRVAAVPSGE